MMLIPNKKSYKLLILNVTIADFEAKRKYDTETIIMKALIYFELNSCSFKQVKRPV